MNKNDSIRCSVVDCKYHNCNYCSLDKISVACTCTDATKKETICDSFKKKKD